MENLRYGLFAVIFTASFMVQGTTGFGAVVLALPILAFFFPIKELIPVAIAVNILQSGWIVIRDRRFIDRRHARIMVSLALLGLPLGFLIYRYLPSEELKIGLGGFVVLVAIWNLVAEGKNWRPVNAEKESSPPGFFPQLPAFVYYPLLFVGGIVEGALAAAGPFVVIYAARMIPQKTSFRATISLLWIILNLVMIGIYSASRVWTRSMIPLMIILAPCVLLGTWLGILLHDRIPQKPFRVIVFTLLFLSGLVLLKPLFSPGD